MVKEYTLYTLLCCIFGDVVESVDTPDSKSGAVRREGSNPSVPT